MGSGIWGRSRERQGGSVLFSEVFLRNPLSAIRSPFSALCSLIRNSQFAIRSPFSALCSSIRNSQFAIRSPFSALRSSIRNSQFAIRSPFSALRSSIRNSQFAIRNSLVIFLPLLPSLLVYLSGTPVHYAAYSLPKGLLLGLLILLYIQPRTSPGPGWTAGMSLTLILEMGGFTPLALLAGCAGIISTLQVSRTERAGLVLLSLVVLTPFLDGVLIQWMRDASLYLVDNTLRLLGIPFERQGVVYILEGIRAEIWERCSGYSTARVLVAGWVTLFFLQKQYRSTFILALPLGVLAGLLINLLRIVTHLLLAATYGHAPAEGFHIAAGLAAFLLITGLLLIPLLNLERLRNGLNKDDSPVFSQTTPGYCAISLVIFLLGVLLVVPGRLIKRVEHSYRVWPDLQLNVSHINQFQEFPGNGGWILLEHDLRHCFRWFGYQEQGERLIRAGDEVAVTTQFRTGDLTVPTRWEAIQLRLLRPDLALLPLETVITVTEFTPRQRAEEF